MTKASDFSVRQGDILLIRVADVIEAPKRPATKGNHLLALGEATGHAHYVPELEAAMLEANEAMRQVAAEYGITEPAAVIGGLRVLAGGATLWHGTPVLDPAGPRDADHAPIALLPGDYVVVRPREYDDSEEIRLIAD